MEPQGQPSCSQRLKLTGLCLQARKCVVTCSVEAVPTIRYMVQLRNAGASVTMIHVLHIVFKTLPFMTPPCRLTGKR
jgi:hypothetical protein